MAFENASNSTAGMVLTSNDERLVVRGLEGGVGSGFRGRSGKWV